MKMYRTVLSSKRYLSAFLASSRSNSSTPSKRSITIQQTFICLAPSVVFSVYYASRLKSCMVGRPGIFCYCKIYASFCIISITFSSVLISSSLIIFIAYVASSLVTSLTTELSPLPIVLITLQSSTVLNQLFPATSTISIKNYLF